MSLRVLLADESDTIKKVFQLALQDLNAEIKSVHSGLDVIDVAHSFQPAIIFADVLLQKKNGYDTCREIKQNPNLGRIPVVLMWSSFMELDQEQFKSCKANDQLEKPFDADFLRALIKKHVPQAQDNPMGQFLNFPKSITADLKKETSKVAPNPLPETPLKEDTSEFNIASFLDEELQQPDAPAAIAVPEPAGKEEAWASTDLSKFKLDLEAPADNLEKFEALNLGERSQAIELPASLEAPGEIVPIEVASVPETVDKPALEITSFNLPPSKAPPPPAIEEPPVAPSATAGALDQILQMDATATPSGRTTTETKTRMPAGAEGTNSKKITTVGLDDDEIEAIIRAHTEEIIKTQIFDSLQDIIERVVRDELSKILDEEVRLKQEINSDNA